MKKFLLHIHQLPQHIIAWILILFGAKFVGYMHIDINHTCKIYESSIDCSCSLGNYIFLSYFDAIEFKHDRDEITIKHEMGHSMQSKKLGWLYLFVIGIPSACWNLYHRKHPEKDYYKFYTEAWADKLGGVKR